MPECVSLRERERERTWTYISVLLVSAFVYVCINSCLWLCASMSDMVKTILQGIVKGARSRGRQKRWEDNVKEWTGMGFGDSPRAVEDREGRKGIIATSSVVPRRPPRLRD